jgi:hypothetical protein
MSHSFIDRRLDLRNESKKQWQEMCKSFETIARVRDIAKLIERANVLNAYIKPGCPKNMQLYKEYQELIIY